MLRKRVVPIVLLDGFSVLKTIQFKIRRNLGSPITVARTYNTRNVDELILLDIDASIQKRAIDAFTIKDVGRELFMPLTVGGGIRTVADVQLALQMGADKVAINTAAIKNPDLIAETASIFGSQCIVGVIDFVKRDEKYLVCQNGVPIKDMEALEWAQCLETLGAGELLIYSVDLDGTMAGPDIQFAQLISNKVNIPVIYSGGVSNKEDCVKLGQTNLSGIGVSSIFHFTGITPLECKEEMSKYGIAVRV
jgi:imidazole glycerol-phosphate synthase subunit HisF